MDIETVGPIVFLTPRTAEIEVDNSQEFIRDMAPHLTRGVRAVCDLTHVGLLDSAGMAALLTCLRRAGEAGGDLKLCCPSRGVLSVLRTARMHRSFDILATRDEALGAFAK